jgi:hypothetical protein
MGRVGPKEFLAAEGEGLTDERETVSVSQDSGRREEEIGLGGVGAFGGDDGSVGEGILRDGVVGGRSKGDRSSNSF